MGTLPASLAGVPGTPLELSPDGQYSDLDMYVNVHMEV